MPMYNSRLYRHWIWGQVCKGIVGNQPPVSLGHFRMIKLKGYMYTLKQIIDAWENNYGGDMEKDYPRFFKELKKLQAKKL